MSESKAPRIALPERRRDVDWLRVLAVYLLFVFHVAMVFNPAPFYHIRNGELSYAMLVGAGFIGLWHMPLLFLLAGWSAHASLAARGASSFVRERVLKLWVPLVAGCLLLMPAIKYLELRSGLDANYSGLYVSPELQPGFAAVIPQGLPAMAPFRETFLEFLPTFFTRLDRFTWAHLWFIAYLLVFTVLYLPIFRWLRARRGVLASAPGWWVYLPIVPLALVQIFLRPRWPGLQNLYDDWANVAYYSIYLLAGFLLACHPALERAVHREWRRALGFGLAASLVLLLGVLGVFAAPSLPLAGTAVAGWCFVLGLLGAANRYLTPVGAGLPYLAESAFPVYWLHQAAIVLIGYPIVHLGLGIAAKYALLLVASVSATLLVYHFVMRRFSITRFCIGMKRRPSRLQFVMGKAAALSLAVALLAGCTTLKRFSYEGSSRDDWQQPERVVSALGLRAGDRVADLGAGSGYFTVRLARAVGPSGRVYAVDVDEAMNEYLRKRVAEAGVTNVEVILGRFDDPLLPDAGVDLVLVVDTYHHLQDRVAYFRNLRRDLAPGGRVAVIDFDGRKGWFVRWMGHITPRELLQREMAEAGYAVAEEFDFIDRQLFVIFRAAGG